MKQTIALIALVLLAVPAIAADLQEITLPAVPPAPPEPVNELPPVMLQANEGGGIVAADLGAAAAAMRDGSWTGFHPGLWLRNNWKPVVGTLATAGAVWGAYEIYDHNRGSGGSSKSAAAPAEEDDEPAPPTVGGDAMVVGINGDGNTVTIYNRPSGAAAE